MLYIVPFLIVVFFWACYEARKQHKDLEFIRVEGEYNIYKSRSTGRLYAEPRFDPGGY
jgi:hypothetical protein